MDLVGMDVKRNNGWDFSRISFEVPTHIRTSIHNSYTQLFMPKKDTHLWNISSGGKFSASSAYNLYLDVDKENYIQTPTNLN